MFDLMQSYLFCQTSGLDFKSVALKWVKFERYWRLTTRQNLIMKYSSVLLIRALQKLSVKRVSEGATARVHKKECGMV